MSEVPGPPVPPTATVEQAPPVAEPDCVVVRLGLACIGDVFGEPTPPIGEEHTCQVVRRIRDKDIACRVVASLQLRETEPTTHSPVRLRTAHKTGAECLDTQITMAEQLLKLVRWVQEGDPEDLAGAEEPDGPGSPDKDNP